MGSLTWLSCPLVGPAHHCSCTRTVLAAVGAVAAALALVTRTRTILGGVTCRNAQPGQYRHRHAPVDYHSDDHDDYRGGEDHLTGLLHGVPGGWQVY